MEVKGYPLSGKYANPNRAGEKKRTKASLQAAHWFAEALSTLLARRQLVETYAVDQSAPLPALAFPVEKVYRDRVEAVEWALEKLGVKVFWVLENGRVTYQPQAASRPYPNLMPCASGRSLLQFTVFVCRRI